MAVCPNCGRQTMRTSDWVCQWCGYPLLGRGYKKIDKTFKQLQEERRAGLDESAAAGAEERAERGRAAGEAMGLPQQERR